jgi:hypothetical protein
LGGPKIGVHFRQRDTQARTGSSMQELRDVVEAVKEYNQGVAAEERKVKVTVNALDSYMYVQGDGQNNNVATVEKGSNFTDAEIIGIKTNPEAQVITAISGLSQNQSVQSTASANVPSGDYLVASKEGQKFLVPLKEDSIETIVVKRPAGVGQWVWERFKGLREVLRVNVEDQNGM